MAQNHTGFNYEVMVQNALRVVVKQALEETAKHGLIGNHHFYISFVTNHTRVVLPEYLHEEYPDEMTIVLQHEFWDLIINDDRFEITLCFDDLNEHIVVPFEAITSFVDPSVKFGLQFTPEYGDAEEEIIPKTAEFKPIDNKPKKASTKKDKTKTQDGSNVVTLDSFRKK